MHKDHWKPRLAVFALCVLGALALVRVSPAAAVVPVVDVAALEAAAATASDGPTKLAFPNTDGGVIYAPPRQFAAVAMTFDVNVKDILIQNPNDSDQNPGLVNIRVGTSGVRAWPVNRKNGIILRPGESVGWNIPQDGTPYVISESTTDAGVSVNGLAGHGGR